VLFIYISTAHMHTGSFRTYRVHGLAMGLIPDSEVYAWPT
jgi:hypothetical protein